MGPANAASSKPNQLDQPSLAIEFLNFPANAVQYQKERKKIMQIKLEAMTP